MNMRFNLCKFIHRVVLYIIVIVILNLRCNEIILTILQFSVTNNYCKISFYRTLMLGVEKKARASIASLIIKKICIFMFLA